MGSSISDDDKLIFVAVICLPSFFLLDFKFFKEFVCLIHSYVFGIQLRENPQINFY